MLGKIIDTMASLEYGILISLVIAGLLLFTIAVLNGKKQLNVLSFIIAALLMIPLSFQMSRLIGAYNISTAASNITDVIGLVSPVLKKYASSFTDKEIGWFVFRRVMWSIVFTGTAGVLIYVTMERKTSKHHNLPNGIQTGRL